MKIASAIVTNRGGRTCHAAIISRELGLAAIVGTEDATDKLHEGDAVTVSCAEGDTGHVYQGVLQIEETHVHVSDDERPKTHVMMNMANPDLAFEATKIPNDGVGLVRQEFIITNHIGVHPCAVANLESVDVATRRQIREKCVGYASPRAFFVSRLSEGLGTIAAAFYPKPVVVRLSDFKTNEYAHLLGGESFEPHEENPMIGWRGASRYYDEAYREGFALECEALARVRSEMGLSNVIIMVPFCRTLDEGKRVQQEMARHGLVRGQDGLKLYVMCEIPANVILAEEFAQLFDGMSIGSNDLTQLVLGVDRDSNQLAHLFDERNEAVKRMITNAIERCHKAEIPIGICGQGPSDYPDFAEFLVRSGIDSMSLTSDVVLKTSARVREIEHALDRA